MIMKNWLVLPAVIFGISCAVGAQEFRIDSLATRTPGVADGFAVIPSQGGIAIGPGSASINGLPVKLDTTTTLAIDPADSVPVKAEEVVLPASQSVKWMPGGHLEKCRTTNMIPGTLRGDSVAVKLLDGTSLLRDKDYSLDERWAKLSWIKGGALTTDTKVLVDYTHSLLRIDGIDLSADGKLRVVRGTPHLVCPVPPDVTSGSLRLVQVFRPYGSAAVEPWHVFVCGPAFKEPRPVESPSIAKALEKLRTGKPVTVVTWGDSVTVGGDTSKPELAYANLFITRLRERFPNASIKHVNAGIGGTNTDGRLPALDQEVLSYKPDLVTIEFVNDMSIPVEHVEKNWNEALTRIKAAGAEAIVITPHFTMPEFMGNQYPRGPEMRPGVPLLKKLAAQHEVGLADTSLRWEHLDVEGIPYITLLYNGINHPNDRGHEMFVKDLMLLFPK